MSSFRLSHKGFSLIEIMVAVTIFLVLSTMVIVAFRSTQTQNELRDARSLIISHTEALRSDARSGKVVGAGVPRAYLIAFEPGAAYFIEATDIGGCGVSSEEQIYSTVQLPKGVRVSPALLGIIEISFYVPGGNMVIGPQCPVDRVCVAPCDVSDVAASDVTFSIPLVHDNGQEDTITFDMIRGVVE